MNINRTNGVPPGSAPAETTAPAESAAPSQPAGPSQPAAASEPRPVSRAELHGPGQAEILRQSLMALLDRASASMGTLPAASREKCAEILAADPFLSARLLSYLEQKAL